MKNDNKTTDHHGFCENPESKCTLNYCDENGCTERKRYLVDLVTPTTMSDKERIDKLKDDLNTENHLVKVYKIQAQTAQERNKELTEALRIAIFYLQGTGRDLSKMESLIK